MTVPRGLPPPGPPGGPGPLAKKWPSLPASPRAGFTPHPPEMARILHASPSFGSTSTDAGSEWQMLVHMAGQLRQERPMRARESPRPDHRRWREGRGDPCVLPRPQAPRARQAYAEGLLPPAHARDIDGGMPRIASRSAWSTIVGLQPEVAFAMLQLGLSLEGVATALDLEEGLAFLNWRTKGTNNDGG